MIWRERGRRIFVGLFMTLLLLPAIQMLTGVVSVRPLDENRNRATPPAVSDLASPLTAFPKVQAWFQDHYGLRDLLIRTKTQIDFSFFGVSDRVHIGRDGWLYDRKAISTSLAIESLSEADLDLAAKTLGALGEQLASRGVRLIVLTVQHKH